MENEPDKRDEGKFVAGFVLWVIIISIWVALACKLFMK